MPEYSPPTTTPSAGLFGLNNLLSKDPHGASGFGANPLATSGAHEIALGTKPASQDYSWLLQQIQSSIAKQANQTNPVSGVHGGGTEQSNTIAMILKKMSQLGEATSNLPTAKKTHYKHVNHRGFGSKPPASSDLGMFSSNNERGTTSVGTVNIGGKPSGSSSLEKLVSSTQERQKLLESILNFAGTTETSAGLNTNTNAGVDVRATTNVKSLRDQVLSELLGLGLNLPTDSHVTAVGDIKSTSSTEQANAHLNYISSQPGKGVIRNSQHSQAKKPSAGAIEITPYDLISQVSGRHIGPKSSLKQASNRRNSTKLNMDTVAYKYSNGFLRKPTQNKKLESRQITIFQPKAIVTQLSEYDINNIADGIKRAQQLALEHLRMLNGSGERERKQLISRYLNNQDGIAKFNTPSRHIESGPSSNYGTFSANLEGSTISGLSHLQIIDNGVQKQRRLKENIPRKKNMNVIHTGPSPTLRKKAAAPAEIVFNFRGQTMDRTQTLGRSDRKLVKRPSITLATQAPVMKSVNSKMILTTQAPVTESVNDKTKTPVTENANHYGKTLLRTQAPAVETVVRSVSDEVLFAFLLSLFQGNKMIENNRTSINLRSGANSIAKKAKILEQFDKTKSVIVEQSTVPSIASIIAQRSPRKKGDKRQQTFQLIESADKLNFIPRVSDMQIQSESTNMEPKLDYYSNFKIVRTGPSPSTMKRVDSRTKTKVLKNANKDRTGADNTTQNMAYSKTEVHVYEPQALQSNGIHLTGISHSELTRAKYEHPQKRTSEIFHNFVDNKKVGQSAVSDKNFIEPVDTFMHYGSEYIIYHKDGHAFMRRRDGTTTPSPKISEHRTSSSANAKLYTTLSKHLQTGPRPSYGLGSGHFTDGFGSTRAWDTFNKDRHSNTNTGISATRDASTINHSKGGSKLGLIFTGKLDESVHPNARPNKINNKLSHIDSIVKSESGSSTSYSSNKRPSDESILTEMLKYIESLSEPVGTRTVSEDAQFSIPPDSSHRKSSKKSERKSFTNESKSFVTNSSSVAFADLNRSSIVDRSTLMSMLLQTTTLPSVEMVIDAMPHKLLVHLLHLNDTYDPDVAHRIQKLKTIVKKRHRNIAKKGTANHSTTGPSTPGLSTNASMSTRTTHKTSDILSTSQMSHTEGKQTFGEGQFKVTSSQNYKGSEAVTRTPRQVLTTKPKRHAEKLDKPSHQIQSVNMSLGRNQLQTSSSNIGDDLKQDLYFSKTSITKNDESKSTKFSQSQQRESTKATAYVDELKGKQKSRGNKLKKTSNSNDKLTGTDLSLPKKVLTLKPKRHAQRLDKPRRHSMQEVTLSEKTHKNSKLQTASSHIPDGLRHNLYFTKTSITKKDGSKLTKSPYSQERKFAEDTGFVDLLLSKLHTHLKTINDSLASTAQTKQTEPDSIRVTVKSKQILSHIGSDENRLEHSGQVSSRSTKGLHQYTFTGNPIIKKDFSTSHSTELVNHLMGLKQELLSILNTKGGRKMPVTADATTYDSGLRLLNSASIKARSARAKGAEQHLENKVRRKRSSVHSRTKRQTIQNRGSSLRGAWMAMLIKRIELMNDDSLRALVHSIGGSGEQSKKSASTNVATNVEQKSTTYSRETQGSVFPKISLTGTNVATTKKNLMDTPHISNPVIGSTAKDTSKKKDLTKGTSNKNENSLGMSNTFPNENKNETNKFAESFGEYESKQEQHMLDVKAKAYKRKGHAGGGASDMRIIAITELHPTSSSLAPSVNKSLTVQNLQGQSSSYLDNITITASTKISSSNSQPPTVNDEGSKIFTFGAIMGIGKKALTKTQAPATDTKDSSVQVKSERKLVPTVTGLNSTSEGKTKLKVSTNSSSPETVSSYVDNGNNNIVQLGAVLGVTTKRKSIAGGTETAVKAAENPHYIHVSESSTNLDSIRTPSIDKTNSSESKVAANLPNDDTNMKSAISDPSVSIRGRFDLGAVLSVESRPDGKTSNQVVDVSSGLIYSKPTQVKPTDQEKASVANGISTFVSTVDHLTENKIEITPTKEKLQPNTTSMPQLLGEQIEVPGLRNQTQFASNVVTSQTTTGTTTNNQSPEKTMDYALAHKATSSLEMHTNGLQYWTNVSNNTSSMNNDAIESLKNFTVVINDTSGNQSNHQPRKIDIKSPKLRDNVETSVINSNEGTTYLQAKNKTADGGMLGHDFRPEGTTYSQGKSKTADGGVVGHDFRPGGTTYSQEKNKTVDGGMLGHDFRPEGTTYLQAKSKTADGGMLGHDFRPEGTTYSQEKNKTADGDMLGHDFNSEGSVSTNVSPASIGNIRVQQKVSTKDVSAVAKNKSNNVRTKELLSVNIGLVQQQPERIIYTGGPVQGEKKSPLLFENEGNGDHIKSPNAIVYDKVKRIYDFLSNPASNAVERRRLLMEIRDMAMGRRRPRASPNRRNANPADKGALLSQLTKRLQSLDGSRLAALLASISDNSASSAAETKSSQPLNNNHLSSHTIGQLSSTTDHRSLSPMGNSGLSPKANEQMNGFSTVNTGQNNFKPTSSVGRFESRHMSTEQNFESPVSIGEMGGGNVMSASQSSKTDPRTITLNERQTSTRDTFGRGVPTNFDFMQSPEQPPAFAVPQGPHIDLHTILELPPLRSGSSNNGRWDNTPSFSNVRASAKEVITKKEVNPTSVLPLPSLDSNRRRSETQFQVKRGLSFPRAQASGQIVKTTDPKLLSVSALLHNPTAANLQQLHLLNSGFEHRENRHNTAQSKNLNLAGATRSKNSNLAGAETSFDFSSNVGREPNHMARTVKEKVDLAVEQRSADPYVNWRKVNRKPILDVLGRPLPFQRRNTDSQIQTRTAKAVDVAKHQGEMYPLTPQRVLIRTPETPAVTIIRNHDGTISYMKSSSAGSNVDIPRQQNSQNRQPTIDFTGSPQPQQRIKDAPMLQSSPTNFDQMSRYLQNLQKIAQNMYGAFSGTVPTGRATNDGQSMYLQNEEQSRTNRHGVFSDSTSRAKTVDTTNYVENFQPAMRNGQYNNGFVKLPNNKRTTSVGTSAALLPVKRTDHNQISDGFIASLPSFQQSKQSSTSDAFLKVLSSLQQTKPDPIPGGFISSLPSFQQGKQSSMSGRALNLNSMSAFPQTEHAPIPGGFIDSLPSFQQSKKIPTETGFAETLSSFQQNQQGSTPVGYVGGLPPSDQNKENPTPVGSIGSLSSSVNSDKSLTQGGFMDSLNPGERNTLSQILSTHIRNQAELTTFLKHLQPMEQTQSTHISQLPAEKPIQRSHAAAHDGSNSVLSQAEGQVPYTDTAKPTSKPGSREAIIQQLLKELQKEKRTEATPTETTSTIATTTQATTTVIPETTTTATNVTDGAKASIQASPNVDVDKGVKKVEPAEKTQGPNQNMKDIKTHNVTTETMPPHTAQQKGQNFRNEGTWRELPPKLQPPPGYLPLRHNKPYIPGLTTAHIERMRRLSAASRKRAPKLNPDQFTSIVESMGDAFWFDGIGR